MAPMRRKGSERKDDRGRPAFSPTAEHYEQIIDSLTSGVIAFDADGVIIMVNRAARDHLGVPEERLYKGMRLDDLLELRPFVDVLHGVLTTHAPVTRQEVVLSRPDGGKKEIGFSASLLQGPREFNGAVFLFVDMTERRALERVAELNRQLAQIGELTAGVVHELRNPLSVISGMAELVQRRIEPTDPRHKSVTTILNEAKHLERLVAQFLGFAKPFELDVAPCRVETVVERTVALCQPRAQTKNVTLAATAQAGLPEMNADAEKLSQALVNIVSNGIDAVADGGHVWIHASREQADIRFEIADDGPGIRLRPGEDPFSPFFSKKEGGTGLGLAICHRIVTAHAGSVTYGNREEGGARFTVRVPIERAGLR